MKKITIITATFNSEETIIECLNSVKTQTCLDRIQHIIIDGKSQDSTITIASNYNHIEIIISEPDRGIFHAFNKGIALSQGDIIYFLNSDDKLYKDNTIQKVLESFPVDALFYAGKVLFEDKLTNECTTYPTGSYNLKKNKNPCHQGFFCRKEVFEKYGLFNECFKTYADSYLMRSLVKQEKGYFTDQIIAYFRKGGASTSKSNFQDNAIQRAALDILTDDNSSSISTIKKLTRNTENLAEIRKLFLNHLLNNIKTNKFQNKVIGIFGAHELSKIIHLLLKLKKINTVGLIVTDNHMPPNDEGIEVFNLYDLPYVDIVINCIEGYHESEITTLLKKTLINTEILSWRNLNEL